MIVAPSKDSDQIVHLSESLLSPGPWLPTEYHAKTDQTTSICMLMSLLGANVILGCSWLIVNHSVFLKIKVNEL